MSPTATSTGVLAAAYGQGLSPLPKGDARTVPVSVASATPPAVTLKVSFRDHRRMSLPSPDADVRGHPKRTMHEPVDRQMNSGLAARQLHVIDCRPSRPRRRALGTARSSPVRPRRPG